jgi:hypothetical protein
MEAKILCGRGNNFGHENNVGDEETKWATAEPNCCSLKINYWTSKISGVRPIPRIIFPYGRDIILQVPLITDDIIQQHPLQITDADSINSWSIFPKQDRVANRQDLMRNGGKDERKDCDGRL